MARPVVLSVEDVDRCLDVREVDRVEEVDHSIDGVDEGVREREELRRPARQAIERMVAIG